MINMKALSELLEAKGITPRIVRVDLWGELEMMADSALANWPPKPQRGEMTLAIDADEDGRLVAVFIPKEV